jgi:hypothetical protein
MAEDKRSNPYPFPTAAEIEAAPGDRETKAARNIMVRNVPGIPRRPFLLGDSDHAPILQGVKDLTTVCWAVIDAIHAEQDMSAEEFARSQATMDAVDRMEAILCDHGCPDEAPAVVEDA